MAAWVLTSERQPEKPGHYQIRRKKGDPAGGYYWNGGYWVTPGGSPTNAVARWLDEGKDGETDDG